jgi:hypothetical protein
LNIYFFEFLAVLAVIIWAGALVGFIGSDMVRWKHHHLDQGHRHRRQPRG